MANAKAKTGDMSEAFDTTYRWIADIRDEIHNFIWGQEQVVDLSLTTLLSGGHMLLVGLPGLGKTRLVSVMGTVLGLETGRIQCTPDLMPADITGSEILAQDEDGNRHFKFVEGPVFCQFLMADEINRASPRTQSALLQAMQEYTVTVGGHNHALPQPFHVMATQNPLEQEGTYPLPEAQLDRFLMQINVTYPTLADEKDIIAKTTTASEKSPKTLTKPQELIKAQALVRQMPIGENVVDAILDIVRRGRPEQSDLAEVQDFVSWGPGPRAGQAFMLAARARALVDGRHAPSMDDVIALAEPILQHRMALSFPARTRGITLQQIITKICEKYV
ncbi:MAG: MoxR family ATPase [Pseudomonadota bacterium]|nr:MoxR family ATPase [Pseudomonadota bacterium]QKK04465.1 MAG: MoxR family ATPase [Pseudomonadota bacterium]